MFFFENFFLVLEALHTYVGDEEGPPVSGIAPMITEGG
jgi:hypothetical protein